MVCQLASVPTSAGASVAVVPPSPSWPLLSFPHDQSVPSVLTARVCPEPPMTDCQSAAVPISTGLVASVVVAFPTWPNAFQPKAQSVPSLLKATV